MEKTFVEKIKESPLLLKLLFIAVLAPTVANLGIEYKDINSWQEFINVLVTMIMNPYLLGTTIIGIIIFVQDTKKNKDTSNEE